MNEIGSKRVLTADSPEVPGALVLTQALTTEKLTTERATPTGPTRSQVSPHLLALPGSETWALWRTACLRSAGFPVTTVFCLASERCAMAADEVLRAEAVVARRGATATEAARHALRDASGEAQRRALKRVLRRLGKGNRPEESELHLLGDEVERAVGEWERAYEKRETARAELPEQFSAGMQEVAAAIRHLAQDERFREALIWQNRQAFTRGVSSLAGKTSATFKRGFRERQNEEVVASYGQRYSVKNDTIGFFGPVGWATLNEELSGLRLRAGAQLVASSEVYFESWCMDAVAAVLSREAGARPWLIPRRSPFVGVTGRVLHLPGGGEKTVSESVGAMLASCDGQRTGAEVAERMKQAGMVSSNQECYQMLEACQQGGLLVWDLALPLEVHSEQRLRQWAERVGDERLRKQSLQVIEELEECRERIGRAAGAAEVDKGLAELEERFTKWTGEAATRAAGQTYAGRTLVYSDSRRDVDVEVGREVLEELSGPLELLLTSGRWLTYEVAQVYREAFRQLYAQLSSRSNSPFIDFISFWMKAESSLLKDQAAMMKGAAKELQERWAKILKLPDGERRVSYRSAELAAAVHEEFAAPRAGWQLARYHSPDVMIAAESVEAIRRGDFQLVVGEVHLSTNTLRGALFLNQHPDPKSLFHAIEDDLPEPRVVPILRKSWPKSTTRTTLALISPRDFCLEFALDSLSQGRPEQTLRIGDLVIEDSPLGLRVSTRDRQLSFDIIEFFGEVLSSQLVNHFEVIAKGHHTPRVEIDRLVVARESWRFPPGLMEFAHEADEAKRFLGARRFAQDHLLPRHVFVKMAGEVKPFYVDFDSPVLVNIFAKAVRRATLPGTTEDEVAVTEMLPGLEAAWLEDSAGARYTSELRIIALDLLS